MPRPPRDLIGAVLALPREQLWDLFDRLAGRPEVAAAGWRLAERRLSAERYPRRNAEIRRRKAEGRSYGQLARDYGLSRSRIGKIVRAGRQKVCPSNQGTHLARG